MSRRSLGGGPRYRPDLVLTGQVACADGFVQRMQTQRVRGEWLTGTEVERGLEAVGRIHIQHGARVCTITPDFTWRGGQLAVANTFAESCRFVRGGGPRYYRYYSY
jgi:hypothetical protein